MKAIVVPDFWESLLKRYVKRTFYPGTRRDSFSDRAAFTEGDYRFFAKGIARLNAYFTRERGELPKDYFNQKELRSGYLLYFLPVNALKVAGLLGQMRDWERVTQVGRPTEAQCNEHRRAEPEAGPVPKLTILDIGSGPGTGMFGAFHALVQRGFAGKLHWILIDQNRHALQDAVSLHRELVEIYRRQGLAIESEVETIPWDIGRHLPKLPAADLILSLNLMGELPPGRRPGLIGQLIGNLREEGRLLVIEPALQKTTRELMELHDILLRRRAATIYAPCLHQAACPMLAANRRDWCHTTMEWERPPFVEKFDRLVGIRKDYLNCSYLLLGIPRSDLTPHPPLLSKERGSGGGKVWRVVSGHLNSRGKSEMLFCGRGALPALLRAVRLDRDQSDANHTFDELQRGDLVRMERTTRITKTTQLSKFPDRSGQS